MILYYLLENARNGFLEIASWELINLLGYYVTVPSITTSVSSVAFNTFRNQVYIFRYCQGSWNCWTSSYPELTQKEILKCDVTQGGHRLQKICEQSSLWWHPLFHVYFNVLIICTVVLKTIFTNIASNEREISYWWCCIYMN